MNLKKQNIVLICLTIISSLLLFLYFLYTKYSGGNKTVHTVIQKIEPDVRKRLSRPLSIAGYNLDYPAKIIIAAFKEEQRLHLYIEDSNGIQLIKEYPFTATSGVIGPKLKRGDNQIPEGIYKIEHLNPNSAYYLSLKINYPNEFDISKTKLEKISDMGDNIFIHGKASSVGCIAVGDLGIEEIFVLAHKAIHNEILVIVSPRDFRVNPTYPSIADIDWENELYDRIYKQLKKLPL